MQNTCEVRPKSVSLMLLGLLACPVGSRAALTPGPPTSSQPGLARAVGRSSAGRQAVGKAEHTVSCDYLLCFGAEQSGSRWS